MEGLVVIQYPFTVNDEKYSGTVEDKIMKGTVTNTSTGSIE